MAISSILLLFLTLGASAAAPLWHLPLAPTASRTITHSMDLYRVEGTTVTIIRAFMRLDRVEYDMANAEVYGTAVKYLGDENVGRYDGPGGVQQGYCQTRYARTYLEGNVVVLHTWTHERPVLAFCPFGKSERARRNGQEPPIRQQFLRFAPTASGELRLSRTSLSRSTPEAGFAPAPFHQMVRLE